MHHRLLLVLLGFTAIGSGAIADQPPPPPRPPAPSQDADTDRAGASEPDDEFIEFLGADDVGDAAWWEFLKKSGPPPGNAGGTQGGTQGGKP